MLQLSYPEGETSVQCSQCGGDRVDIITHEALEIKPWFTFSAEILARFQTVQDWAIALTGSTAPDIYAAFERAGSLTGWECESSDIDDIKGAYYDHRATCSSCGYSLTSEDIIHQIQVQIERFAKEHA